MRPTNLLATRQHSSSSNKQQQQAAGRKPDATRAVAPICIGYGWFLDDDSWRGGGEHQSRPSMAETQKHYLACMSDFYCGICAENFSDGARCPRVMPCGHSVCHTCAVRIVPDQRCPSCRAPFSVARAEDMPKNWAVFSILQRVELVPTTSLERLCHTARDANTKARTGIIAAAEILDVGAVRGYIIADANCVNERGQ